MWHMLRSLQTNYVLRASRIIHRKRDEIFILSLWFERIVRLCVYSRVQEWAYESFKITLTFIFFIMFFLDIRRFHLGSTSKQMGFSLLASQWSFKCAI